MDKIHGVLAVTGITFLLWFAVPIAARIINIGNLTGMAVSGLLVYYALFYEKVHAGVFKLWQSSGGKAAFALAAAVILCIAVTAVVLTIGVVCAAVNGPPENTTAVVLGCRVRGIEPSRVLKERLDAAYEYLKENPKALCVLSGGQGPGEDITEAECMYRCLTGKGIDGARLIREDTSTTTEENLRFSMRVLEERGIEGDITIVTSEFHEYRANKTAKRLGITSYSTPSRTFFVYLPTYYVRELYGILYYMMM